MEILNLDELVAPKRTVKLKGRDYPVAEMSVQSFVEIYADAKALGENVDPAQNMEATIRLLTKYLPTMEETTLRALPIEAIAKLTQFVRGELDKEVLSAGEQGNAGTQ
jgi:hypothetical protein